MDPSADAGTLALAVLAHDHPVQVGRRAVAQRAADAGQQARRPHVGVLIEALADRQPQAPQADMVGHPRVAGGAEQDRVEAADALQAVGWHHPAVPKVMVRAPVEPLDLETERLALLQYGQHRQARLYDLGADAVAGYRRHSVEPIFS